MQSDLAAIIIASRETQGRVNISFPHFRHQGNQGLL